MTSLSHQSDFSSPVCIMQVAKSIVHLLKATASTPRYVRHLLQCQAQFVRLYPDCAIGLPHH